MILILIDMITIHMKYFNALAAAAGRKEHEIVLPDSYSVMELLVFLGELNPGPFKSIILVGGKVSPHLSIFHNDRHIHSDLDHTQLVDGDTVLLFPAVSGG